jgi:hypothetical protein
LIATNYKINWITSYNSIKIASKNKLINLAHNPFVMNINLSDIFLMCPISIFNHFNLPQFFTHLIESHSIQTMQQCPIQTLFRMLFCHVRYFHIYVNIITINLGFSDTYLFCKCVEVNHLPPMVASYFHTH